MFRKLIKWLIKEDPKVEATVPPLPPPPPELSPKEKATAEGKPYVNIIGFELDPNDNSIGSFEIDWNHFFISQLLMQGFKGQNDEQIIDQWFQTVCRTIAMEEYEQYIADPANRVSRKDLGNGRTEFS